MRGRSSHWYVLNASISFHWFSLPFLCSLVLSVRLFFTLVLSSSSIVTLVSLNVYKVLTCRLFLVYV